MKTPWEILGISANATTDEIKAAYRKLAKDNHPDVGGNQDKFLEIKQAYDTLTNTQKPHNKQHNAPFNPFEQFFSSMGGHFQQHFRQSNHELQIEITLDESINGCKRSVHTSNKTFDLTIPAGCQNGDVIKYANIVNSGNSNFPAGDLYVHIIITLPQEFVWHGVDLFCDKTITVWEAMLGTILKIQDPLGHQVNVTVPESTQPNTILKIAQHGAYNRQTKSRSDLLINISINIPKLSEDHKNKISNLIND
jgi:curved DNA-binding protein